MLSSFPVSPLLGRHLSHPPTKPPPPCSSSTHTTSLHRPISPSSLFRTSLPPRPSCFHSSSSLAITPFLPPRRLLPAKLLSHPCILPTSQRPLQVLPISQLSRLLPTTSLPSSCHPTTFLTTSPHHCLLLASLIPGHLRQWWFAYPNRLKPDIGQA